MSDYDDYPYDYRLFYLGAPQSAYPVSKSTKPDELFGNAAYSDAGVRKLKNYVSDNDATMYCGHGLAGDGSTQYARTGITPDIGAFTIYFDQEIPVGNASARLNGGRSSANDRFYFGLNINTANMQFGFGAIQQYSIAHGVTAGEVAECSWTWDGVSATSEVTVRGVLKGTVDMTSIPSSTIEFFFGAFNDAGVASFHQQGTAKNFYYIAEHSTLAQRVNHCKNPENTFFFDGDGNLQSANGYDATKFVADSIAGKAGWIPCCENTTRGAFVTEVASGNLNQIVNYTDTMRTNSEAQTSGFQSLLVTKDEFGVPSGLTKPFELDGDGRSWVDTGAKVLSGDWCIDLYCEDARASTIFASVLKITSYDALDAEVDWSGIYFNAGSTDLKAKRYSVFSDITNPTAILSLERVGDDINLYENGVNKVIASCPSSYDVINYFLATTSGADEADAVAGSLQITEGTRTATQRANEVQLLAQRHGVTL